MASPPPTKKRIVSSEVRELLPSAKLQELVNEVAPGVILEEDVEQ
eukprot:CAMPEP_0184677560 /NCGR_PEP_ID=MMETSP0312-20130426/137_1 /TAXON_ID=31354 /ORGANISM="Compsopogon coeruleus, Strain SAG 36.94" /LENGTH=44 /DNA_ID= /DNA_START= /DNA_END= /DNA_ORIENTATION=